MKERFQRQLASSFEAMALAGAVYFLLIFFIISLNRIDYPFELEWMEGGSVDHVRRVLAGLPLYVRPSMEFTPFIYNPLFFYLSAVVSLFTGVGFFPLRLVGLLATAGCFMVIYVFGKRETGRPLMGIIGAGLFAATFVIGGAWFDLARPDMLFLFFLLASACLLRYSQQAKGAAFAGLLAALSFFSKQNALPFGILMSFYAIIKFQGWKKKAVFPLVFLAMVSVWTAAFHFAGEGWYEYYIFTLPGQHVIHYDMLPSVLFDDMLAHVPLIMLLAVVYIVDHLLNYRNIDTLFHVLFSGGLVSMSVIARMHSGGYNNALIPAYAAFAIYGALGFSYLLNGPLEKPEKSVAFGISQTSLGRIKTPLFIALYIFLALGMVWQFNNLRYDYRQYIPDEEDLAAGDEFISLLQELHGDVYLPYHGYLPSLAGKMTYAQGMALEDVFRSTDEDIRDGLKNEIREAIENKRFSAIILDGEWRFMDEINRNYESIPIEYSGDAFIPVTGMPTRPSLLYLPREQ